MSLTDLPPLGEALKAAGLQADKSFGQHFLLDLNLCRKIVRIAEVANGETVLEIGPGPGGLTRTLLAAGARVVAIEQDRRFAALLEPLAEAAEGRLKIVYADALTADEAALAGAYASIVANLPYNVGTPLLIKWLTGVWRPARLTLMYQLEVASRIVAAPGSADYGRLAVIVQALAQARIALKLPSRAFTPPPKVDSAVVRIDPRADPPADALIEVLQRVTAAAFGQRRKMLRSSLKPLGGAALCEAVGIAPDRRAETLSVDAFLALAAHVASDRR